MWAVWWNSRDWSCVHFGFVKAVWFLWDWLWASSGLPMANQHLTENGASLRYVMVLLWVWSGPSLPLGSSNIL